MGIIVPTLSNGVMTGAGRTAVVEAVGDLGRPPINVTDVRYGADPTGVRDSTGSIQAAIAAAAAQGKGSVEIPAGVYRVSPPFMSLAPEVTVFGHGDATIIVATGNAPAEKIGVFHIGSYNERLQDPRMYRAGLRDLMIKTGDGSQAHQPAIPNVCGVILNTDLGSATQDPDAVHKVSGLTIWDMHIGMAILGRDDQGMKISDVRIRGGQECGLLVGKPPNHPEMLDGSQGQNPGGADNKFSRMDVSSANKDGADRAGIEIYTSNCKFSDSTSWYSKRYHAFDVEPTVTQDTRPAFLDAVRDGAGWFIRGTKNIFTACTAQENGGHGFVLAYPGSVVTGCIAESSAFYDSVKGTAKVGEAHGFMLLNGASDTQLIGCRSGNARGANKGQGYGYYLENNARGITLLGTAAVNAVGDVRLGQNLGSDVVVRVGSTLLNWIGATTTAGASVVEPILPAQLTALAAAWDFSGQSLGAQITSVPASAGSGVLAQSDKAKAPSGAVLGARVGARFNRAEADALNLDAVVSAPASTGYTIVWTGAVNANAKAAQYLFATVAPGSKHIVSLGLTDKLEARAVSTGAGSASGGLVAQTTGAGLARFEPVTMVLRVRGTVLDLWAGQARATYDAASDSTTSHVPADLGGRMVLGAYTDGNNGTTATVGEVSMFREALTDDQVAGLIRALGRKWQ
ncbi:MAG: hypothetical protein L0I17_03920 [Actinomycetia bacterium]|nr:hypothetical protein [Actinomycetes bacterium]